MTKMMTIFLSLMALSFTNILPAQDCPQLLGSAPAAVTLVDVSALFSNFQLTRSVEE